MTSYLFQFILCMSVFIPYVIDRVTSCQLFFTNKNNIVAHGGFIFSSQYCAVDLD